MTDSRPDTRLTVEEHQRHLEARGWPGVPDLARKWGVSRPLVRQIPREKLPYLTFGQSDIRRYDPVDVAAYEEREKTGVAA